MSTPEIYFYSIVNYSAKQTINYDNQFRMIGNKKYYALMLKWSKILGGLQFEFGLK